MNNNDLFCLANQQIQLIILNALNYLTKSQTLSTTHFLSYRLCDIQYSFCLNKQNQQLIQLNSIENFADNFIENLFPSTFHQICRQTLTLIDNKSIHSYVNQFIESTIHQAISNIIQLEIENYSINLTENILTDALSTIVDDELYTQWQLTNENTLIKQQTSKSIDILVNNLAQDIYFRSFDNLREIFTNNCSND